MSSSDLFVFDGSYCSMYQKSSPEDILSPETDLFFFGDHSALENLFQAATTTTTNRLELGSSQFQSPNLTADFPTDSLAVKAEHCHVGFGDTGVENVARLIQRSLSSNSFDFAQSLCSSYSSGFRFDALVESQAFQTQPLFSPQNGFLRKVCSAGDLQSFGTFRTTISERSLMEETTNFKVGKYSAEERKERISKYRAKRTLRNFNKTIKYACRKTLADSRPRIRGRFARNDEPGDSDFPKAPSCSSSRPNGGDGDDDDDFSLEGLHEEEEGIDQTVRGQFVNSYGPTQFQYYGF